MTEIERENLTLAREYFRKGEDSEGIGYYAVVLAENPKNAEAIYFTNYAELVHSVTDRKGIEDAYIAVINSLEQAIKYVANSAISMAEKLAIVKAIVETHTPIVPIVISSRSMASKDAIENGVLSLYWLGSYIKNDFNSDPAAMKLAIVPWKEAVKQHQKFYSYKYEGYKAEDYVAEIQKVDPAYTIPKKAGCISKA